MPDTRHVSLITYELVRVAQSAAVRHALRDVYVLSDSAWDHITEALMDGYTINMSTIECQHCMGNEDEIIQELELGLNRAWGEYLHGVIPASSLLDRVSGEHLPVLIGDAPENSGSTQVLGRFGTLEFLGELLRHRLGPLIGFEDAVPEWWSRMALILSNWTRNPYELICPVCIAKLFVHDAKRVLERGH